MLLLGSVSQAQKTQPGSNAPAFELKDSNGKTHTLSDYKGKIIVLEFTRFSCPFVKKHYDSDNMQNLQKKYTAKKIVWLMVCSSAKNKPRHLSNDVINLTLKAKAAEP
ncbi:MAG: redoxin domain-containing protein, partial [Lentisphaeraceae bacterium]|nr:redoxin domain-containing protein [Lentisphaeraceae bacterium]